MVHSYERHGAQQVVRGQPATVSVSRHCRNWWAQEDWLTVWLGSARPGATIDATGSVVTVRTLIKERAT